MKWMLMSAAILLAACGAVENNDSATDAEPNNAASGADGGSADAGVEGDASAVDMQVEVDMGPFGGERPANYVLPRDWSADKEYPVVVLLHGIGASSRLQNVYFRTSALVDDLQFVLVLPDGTEDSLGRQFWNATNLCCDFDMTGVDDAAYLSELAADAVERFSGDPKRVYFMGHSNGGYMSYRMACDYSDQVAAVASLAGASYVNAANCGDPEPVGVLQIHGTADTTVLFDGRDGYQPGAEEVVNRWVERNGCSTEPRFVGGAEYDTAAPEDETKKDQWTDCDSGVDVQLWTMRDSGHIPTVGEQFTRDILAFLFAHERP